MKKILAVLLAVSLLLGISCAAAEEQATAGDFLQSLARWAQSLNLDESDYYGSVGWAGGLLYDGTIRKNQDFTELAVSGLGRAQISRKKIMLEIGGQKYGIDLTAVVDTITPEYDVVREERSDIHNPINDGIGFYWRHDPHWLSAPLPAALWRRLLAH